MFEGNVSVSSPGVDRNTLHRGFSLR